FELAHLGSILLDEVDDIPYELQVKLLRVIEEKKFERVGGEEQIASDVRIIAASKFNLRELVSEGKFRDDLFYRLGVITINLPPLRDRKEDIHYLAAHFLGKYTACKNMPAPITSGFDKNIPPEILKYLMDYDWPGNVRELENVIEQMVTINKTGKLEIGDLPESLVMPTLLNFKKQESFNLTKMVDKVEREIIEWALTKTGGNQTKASEILGIPRTTLREKMNRIKNP
ncbi:MAG: sigma 54-interacting transcriptional regulator, partial [Planctomycetota bacterium]